MIGFLHQINDSTLILIEIEKGNPRNLLGELERENSHLFLSNHLHRVVHIFDEIHHLLIPQIVQALSPPLSNKFNRNR